MSATLIDRPAKATDFLSSPSAVTGPPERRRSPGGRGLPELAAVLRRLDSAASFPELFRLACEGASEWCGFTRALVLSVEDDHLTASQLGALSDPSSDALRRRVLANPIPLRPGSAEAEAIRLVGGARVGGGRPRCQLGEVLGLRHVALGAVMPEERVLAVLVLDRDERSVRQVEREAVQFFAQSLARSVERLIMRGRMKELGLELRHLTASAQAAVKEALESPCALPTDYGHGPVFPTPRLGSESSDDLRELLTPRELQIAGQLVAGRSNREIAAELHLSPETVKGNVARVLRKLGASNRAEAVSKYLRLVGD